MTENLVNMLPKASNKYSINTFIKYFEQIIQGYHFNLASVLESLILTILKLTQVSKAVGLDSLSRRFPKDGGKFLAKPISGSCNFQNFPDLCKVAKLEASYEKGLLTRPGNYRSISLLLLMSKVIEKSFMMKQVAF